MNVRSLKLIRDVIINSGKWASIEISQDSIYIEFKDVELGTPKHDEEFSLTVRFAGDSFLQHSTITSGILNSCQDTTSSISC